MHHSDLGRNQLLGSKFFMEQKQTVQGKFRSKFIEKHRDLKSAIHLCQHKAYSNQVLKYSESEETAKQCFLPMLLIRRHGQVIIQNADSDLEACMMANKE